MRDKPWKRTIKESFFEYFRPLKYPMTWLGIGAFATAMTYYAYYDQTKKGYKALQELPQGE